MKAISIQQANDILAAKKVQKALVRRLRLSLLAEISEKHWSNLELFALPTKDAKAGVLFIELDGQLFCAPYEINRVASTLNGRSKPVICDFCKTWQAGERSGSITFRTRRASLDSVSFLCCLDLECSLHVRDLTEASKVSRSQIREDISTEYRIERLKNKLTLVVKRLQFEPI